MRIRSATLALFACLAASAAAAPVPQGYTYTDEWFPSADGTRLHAGVFLPSDRKPGEKHPVLVVTGPYTGPNAGVSGASAAETQTEGVSIRFPELFEGNKYLRKDRWAYVQVDTRGFGGSDGCFDYYGPGEASDVEAANVWASKQEWSLGPVGMWGKSYDAATQVLALATGGEGVAATVIQAPGLSAYTALWMNGIHYATGRYGTTAIYTADDLFPQQNLDTLTNADYARSTAAPVTSLPGQPTCRSDALVNMNVIGDRSDPFWTGREVYLGAKRSTVPTLWTHGYYDANTKPVHMDIWESLAGPKYTWLGAFDHKRGHEATVGRGKFFLDEAWAFLDRYVRGVEGELTAPKVTVQEANASGKWRAEEQWPPADATPWAMPLKAGTYTDEPGSAYTSAGGTGVWTVTKPLPGAAHLAGEPTLDVPVGISVPGAHLVALIYDIDKDGKAYFVQRGGMALSSTDTQRATFKLYPVDYRFLAGHRIAVRIVPGDDDWFSPGVTTRDVAVGAGTLTLPLLANARTKFLQGGVSNFSQTAPRFTLPAATIDAAQVDALPPAQTP